MTPGLDTGLYISDIKCRSATFNHKSCPEKTRVTLDADIKKLNGQLTLTANQFGFSSVIAPFRRSSSVSGNNCFKYTKPSVNSGTVHDALTWNVEAPWSLPGLESSPCPLDDTAVGLWHHHNQSATGMGSESQSITGTYRPPLSGPANHIFGTTVPSVSLSCVLLPLSFPIYHPRCWPLSHLVLSSVSSVYLSSSGRKRGQNTCEERKERDRWEDIRTSAPLAFGWPARIPAQEFKDTTGLL